MRGDFSEESSNPTHGDIHKGALERKSERYAQEILIKNPSRTSNNVNVDSSCDNETQQPHPLFVFREEKRKLPGSGLLSMTVGSLLDEVDDRAPPLGREKETPFLSNHKKRKKKLSLSVKINPLSKLLSQVQKTKWKKWERQQLLLSVFASNPLFASMCLSLLSGEN